MPILMGFAMSLKVVELHKRLGTSGQPTGVKLWFFCHFKVVISRAIQVAVSGGSFYGMIFVVLTLIL